MIGLGDDDIAKLAPLAGQLESLLISESRGEYGSGLIHIKNWPHLKSLQLYCYTHGQSLDLTSLSTCPKLEQLTLGRAEWVPVGKRCSSRRLQESDFVEIAKCQGITKLSFSDCSFEGVHLVLLQKMESLKSLSLFNCAPRLATDSRRGVPWRIPLNEKPVPTIGAFDFDAYHPNSIASFEEAFPTDHYNDWKKRILPEVEILRRFGLDNF